MNKLLTIFTLLSLTYAMTQKPIVLMHGIESHAENLEEMKTWLETTFNRKVFNIELGDGDDYSTDTPVYVQIDELRKVLHAIDDLKNGFDFVGISQGGLLGRGLVQKYNAEFCVDNLITLVSPHGGVFIKNLGVFNFYTQKMQSKLSFANYWRDPTKYIGYLLHSHFLADANNEKPVKNPLYKANMIALKNFVMVYSPNDEIVKPPESGIFSFYDHELKVINLNSTELYQQDWLGLKHLTETNRLHMFNTTCSHVDHRSPVCFSQLQPILSQFL